MTMNRHDYFEELISASLAGDLTDAERRQLDAHLDSCAACRATLASFADQRRIMSGLRHVAPPRDLGARVRSGIERGNFGDVPWWRRPVVVFGGLGGGLAAVAGALLAIVLLNGSPDDPQVGGGSESPVPSISVAGSPSLGPETPLPSAAPVGSPAATPDVGDPVELTPEPDVYLAYTGPFDNLGLTLRDGRTGETLRELESSGPPVAAELSPNGQFLAFITQLGESGMNEVWLVHLGADLPLPGLSEAARIETPLAEWQTLSLGRSVAGTPFLEQLSWSPDSRFLAYALAGGNGGGTDVWIFEPALADPYQLTDTGNAYTGSWVAGDRGGASYLWVSLAAEEPSSYLVPLDDEASCACPLDPSAQAGSGSTAIAMLDRVFQPLLSPNGEFVIYWRGVMRQTGDDWAFLEGGAPYLAVNRAFENMLDFEERPLFTDVTIDRDAFTSAGIEWGADSDAFAVWQAQWTGIPQGRGGEYPNINRVYFGHASDSRGVTEDHAIDVGDIPQGASVVDVKVPTGRHLLITAREPIGGIMEAPRARLILVGRNTGDVPDDVEFVTGPGDDGWFGPAAYDAYWEATAP